MYRALLVEPSPRLLKTLYPVLAGCCIFLAFERYNLFPVLFLLPFFLGKMSRLPLKSKLMAYWLMAIVTNLGGFGWIRIVASEYGGLPLPAAYGLVLLFAAGNNVNFVLWAYLERFFGESGNPFRTALLFCVAEQINPQVFPWYLGTALDSVPVLYQTADLWGVIGLSFVLVLLIHFPWWIWRNRANLFGRGRGLFSAQIAFIALVLLYGLITLHKYSDYNHPGPEKKSVAIALVQSNTSLEKFYGQQKSTSERMREFKGLLDMTEKAIASSPDSIDLVVWPESAVHFPILNYEEIRKPIAALAKKYGVYLAAGSAEFVGRKPNGRWEYYNTQFIFDPAGEIVGKYRKIVLLAFGEYIPLVNAFPFLEKMLPESISQFSRGTEKPIFALGHNLHWLPLICYEDIISGFISGFDFRKADFMVNTTNDGWFGKSDASHLHKQMARVRTVEYRKPLVRALNTGASQMIAATGKTISRETDLYTQEFIDQTLYLPPTPPVTIYSVIGNWPIYLCMLAVALFWVRVKMNKAG